MKNNNNTKRTRKTKKSRGFTGGDIPPPAKHTYHTISCPLPRVTESSIVRGSSTGTITANPTVAQAPTYVFSLGSANIGSGYYDQYRYLAVRVTITPQNNAIGLVTNSTTTLVPMYVVIDYDDGTALSSANLASAYSNCVVLNPGESCERTFSPHMALAAYSGAFTSYANVAPIWLDAASTGVQHYGVKVWVPNCTVGQTLLQSWDVTIEHFLEMRKSI